MESGERVIVGVNRHVTNEVDQTRVFQPDPNAPQLALTDLERHRNERNDSESKSSLMELRSACDKVLSGNGVGAVMDSLVSAALADATLGEMQAVLFEKFGRNK